MKKLLYLFSAFALVLTSCSSNNESEQILQATPILITQMTATVVNNGNTESNTATFTYDGTKILSQNYGNYYINYSYTGNLITKIEYFLNDVVISKELYTYNSLEKLVNYQRTEYDNVNGNYGVNVDYVYNSNGTVSYTRNTGNLPNLIPSSTGIINFNNEGLVISIETSTGYTYSYTYDTKNNPVKNVLGFDKLIFSDDDVSSLTKNLVSEVQTNSFGIFTTNFNHTYNSNDYPIQTIEVDGSETVTREYIYNQ